MTSSTVLLLLLSVLLAGSVSFFQYFYKTKIHSHSVWVLAFLRFIGVFGLLLLLINPIITHKTYETQKIPLPIVVDNSSSIKELKFDAETQNLVKEITQNSKLKDQYAVQVFRFSEEVESNDTIDFKGKQSRLDKIGKRLKQQFKNTIHPTILLTDGNQTQGNDYVYTFEENKPIFPVVLGDTTSVLDLKISNLNANKYAFYKNKFPVEIFVTYSGNQKLVASLTVSQGSKTLHTQLVEFSAQKKSQIISVLLPADQVGVQVYKAQINTAQPEKNKYNNSANFAVEVIDQKTEVALVSSINHPDLGALKRAIESNEQRKVTILNALQNPSLEKYNVIVFYQPNATFKPLWEYAQNKGLNTWIITGLQTDFEFLNQSQSHFSFKMSSQKEDYLATFSTQFNLFSIDNLGFENFPPLQNPFGTITSTQNGNTLLNSRVRNVNLETPLLSYIEEAGKRNVYLFGENIWKWRMQSYLDENSFDKFDIFTDKTIQFLASNASRKSLIVSHENFYNSGDAIEIDAQFFNKNFEFDTKARLTITLQNKNTKQTKSYDLIRAANSFKVNLDGLAAGSYSFSVTENNSKTTYNGFFEVLDFDMEKQFVNPDYAKLNQLANLTKGKIYLSNQVNDLMTYLIETDLYTPIQKEIIKKTPLIDWIWLLMIIVLALVSEWFIRKYNGLL